MERETIQWSNLQPLPRKRADKGATRDDLAARKFNLNKAKHKGRCHISNQKRRQMKAEKAEMSKAKSVANNQKYRQLKDAIRAYWSGEADQHP